MKIDLEATTNGLGKFSKISMSAEDGSFEYANEAVKPVIIQEQCTQMIKETLKFAGNLKLKTITITFDY